MDWGNRALELDLVPRNAKGEVIDIDQHTANVVELFRVHQIVRCKPHNWKFQRDLCNIERQRKVANVQPRLSPTQDQNRPATPELPHSNQS